MTNFRASVDLPPAPRSALFARRLLGSILGPWVWGVLEVHDDAILLANGIVTAAVLRARGEHSLRFEVEQLDDHGVRVSIADGSAHQPGVRILEQRHPGGFASSQFGRSNHLPRHLLPPKRSYGRRSGVAQPE